VLPVALGLGDRDEVGAEEHAGHARDAHQPLSEGRMGRARGVAHLEGALGHDHAAGQEFQGRRIRRRFGLDEHGAFVLVAGRFKAGCTLFM
jgi:hypothetical protein